MYVDVHGASRRQRCIGKRWRQATREEDAPVAADKNRTRRSIGAYLGRHGDVRPEAADGTDDGGRRARADGTSGGGGGGGDHLLRVRGRVDARWILAVRRTFLDPKTRRLERVVRDSCVELDSSAAPKRFGSRSVFFADFLFHDHTRDAREHARDTPDRPLSSSHPRPYRASAHLVTPWPPRKVRSRAQHPPRAPPRLRVSTRFSAPADATASR